MRPHLQAIGDEPGPGHALPRLHQPVYRSRAADGMDDTAVARIVATAQRVNSVQGITGLLVWGGGMFFQWREGPRVAITRLMGSIRRDPRHERVVILSETEEVRLSLELKRALLSSCLRIRSDLHEPSRLGSVGVGRALIDGAALRVWTG